MSRQALLCVLCIAVTCACASLASAAHAAPAWRPFALPPPPGGAFETPVGVPGDLQFWDENTGLMTVGGNQFVSEGIYHWDGVAWRQLATVCGGGERARIAFAGPTEFWVIARPSPPRPQTAGFALCHFKDGVVVGSFSTPSGAVDRYAEMLSASCNGPDECWFGGVGAQDGLGQRVGAFHLHWDGVSLRTVYGPQGRAVSDVLHVGGALVESTLLGARPADRTTLVSLAEREDTPRLLHRIAGETFSNDAFVPAEQPGNSELRALDGDGATAWAVGGTANSGVPAGPQRAPLAARLQAGAWVQRALALPPVLPAQFAAGPPVLTGVAAVPGSDEAHVILSQLGIETAESADAFQPVVGLIGASGSVDVQQLEPDAAATRGAAVRIACPAPGDCWMATSRGYLYRYSERGTAYPQDLPPAYQGLITVRPNESAEQGIPDTPPEDDSRLLAPPVAAISESASPAERSCRRPRALISGVSAKARGRTKLVIRFRMARSARVGVVGRRGTRVVARARLRRLKPGRRAIVLRVSSSRRPTRLSFSIRDDRGAQRCVAGDSDDSVSTSPDAAAGDVTTTPSPDPGLGDVVSTPGRSSAR